MIHLENLILKAPLDGTESGKESGKESLAKKGGKEAIVLGAIRVHNTPIWAAEIQWRGKSSLKSVLGRRNYQVGRERAFCRIIPLKASYVFA